MWWRGMLGSLAVAGIVIAVPVPPERVSRPIGEVALPPSPPSRTPAFDEVPGRSGAFRGGPVWAVPKTPDQVSRPIGEVALPPDPPAERVDDGVAVPGRSGSAGGGPVWATPKTPDQVSRPIGEVSKTPNEVSRPIGEVALPAWITTPSFDQHETHQTRQSR